MTSAPQSTARRFPEDALDRRPVRPARTGYTVGMIGFGILFIAAVAATGADFSRLVDFPRNFVDYTSLMTQGVLQVPDAQVRGYWAASLDAMLESVKIAWIGTVVGALFSLPMGFLAARTMTPLPIYAAVRFVLSFIRAVPEIIFAIAIMLPIFGLGPMAGALALGISSVGTLSKLISEAVESVDPGPLESARASGATRVQVVRWAVLPQVLPEIIAIWLYRFEVNIRASAILGVLGAGGVGSLLSTLFDARQWERIGITLVVIIVVTIVVDQISGWIRHRIIHGVPKGGSSDEPGDDPGDEAGADPAAEPGPEADQPAEPTR